MTYNVFSGTLNPAQSINYATLSRAPLNVGPSGLKPTQCNRSLQFPEHAT